MKLRKNIIVAIDGHASCGKSTLAKKIANKLEYRYIDTGAMYRATTLYAIQNDIIKNNEVDEKKLIESLPNIDIDFIYNSEKNISQTFLNNKNVEDKIRKIEVSAYASQVATIKEVRQKLVLLQQKMGEKKCIVMDGRDIGIAVFPNADLKLFLTANAETRARRRYKENIEKDDNPKYEEILANVKKRDKIDSTRKINPLRLADDAILIDNSNLSIEETFAVAMSIIKIRFQ